ncbi:MAG TPA: choice-of-anchor tandem repeat NxxGxxAF-containing protein [Blastocatellia bacterium]|nr:choice-of-anchor tandem repeat NxxGxxAF-containing protein [Blastocatellia bacterium]
MWRRGLLSLVVCDSSKNKSYLVVTICWALIGLHYCSPLARAQAPPERTLQVVALTGTALEAEGSFSQFGNIALNDAGQIAFIAGGGSGLYLQSRDSISPLALTAQKVPGRDSLFFDRFTSVGINNRGDVAFIASFFGSQRGVAVFLHRAETKDIRVIVSSGDRVPGPVFASFQDFLNVFVGDNGEVAFTGLFRDTDLGAFLFAGTLQPVAVLNMPAPGTVGGQFTAASVQALAPDGTILIQAGVQGGQASSGLFLFRAGAWSTVVVAGQTAPGIGGRFSRFSNATLISTSGEVAFEGAVIGGQAAGGIFTTTNGTAQPVLLGGRPIPAAGQRRIVSFSPVRSNLLGEWAVQVTFDDNARGIFLFRRGALNLVILSAQTVTGSSARRFIPTGDLALNASGILAFAGETVQPTTEGIYLWEAGQIRAAITSETTIPAPRHLRLSTDVGLGDDGEVSFTAEMSGNGLGIYRASQEGSNPRILMGKLASGTNGGIFRALGETPSQRRRVAGQSRLAFTAQITGGTATMGVFRVSGETVEAVALTGQPVPGLARATFSGFGHAVINSAGTVAFTCSIDQNATEQEAIVLAPPSRPLQVIAITPQLVPGTSLRYGLLASKDLWLNDRGDLVFTAELDDTSEAVLLYSNGRTRIIARSEQPVPGTNGEALGTFGSVMINNQGVIVFDSVFIGEERSGVFVYDQNQLRAVAISGMEAPGTDGEVFRGVARPAVNDRGDVAFYARWGTAGRGIFLSTTDGLSPILLNGQSLPDDTMRRLTEFHGVTLNNQGDILVSAAVDLSPFPTALLLVRRTAPPGM